MIRFNYGDTPSYNGSFIQFLPVTNPEDAWTDFKQYRAQSLVTMPPEANYTREVAYCQHASCGSGDESKSSLDGKEVADAVDDSAKSDDTRVVSLMKQYGIAVLGLLAGNVVIGLVLCIIGLVACLKAKNTPSRIINPSYTPVCFKEPESGPSDGRYED